MNLKNYRITSIGFLLINSTAALFGGFGLMKDPSGTSIGISLDWLRHSPFHDFFIPGSVLFVVNGLFGLLVIFLILIQHKKYPFFLMTQGVLSGGWILIQMFLLRTVNFLHLIFIMIALILFVAGFLQTKRTGKWPA